MLIGSCLPSVMAAEMSPENISAIIIPDICELLKKIKDIDDKDLNFLKSSKDRPTEPSILRDLLPKIINKLNKFCSNEKSVNIQQNYEKTIDIRENDSTEELVTSKVQTQEIQDANTDILPISKTALQNRNSCFENTVQIKASKSEIDRRIESYMNQKQMEVNEFNRREFSFASGGTSENWSCARTDSVFIPRAGSRSHIKLTKVVNSYGPQTQSLCINEDEIRSESSANKVYGISEGLDERLKNMEKHINVSIDSKDICARIKALEERILFLEGLSPEYFNYVPSRKNRKQIKESKLYVDDNKKDSELSVSDIDQKIQMLQESLWKKQKL